MRLNACFTYGVPGAGLEPAWLSPGDFKSACPCPIGYSP
jgi:hypothetical protein